MTQAHLENVAKEIRKNWPNPERLALVICSACREDWASLPDKERAMLLKSTRKALHAWACAKAESKAVKF